MERERINRDSVSRTIQQKGNFGGAYMVDNRSDKNLNYLSDSPLQRVGDEDEETLQGKLDSPLQRVEDEDDTLQGKFDGTLQKKNETGMPDNLKAGIESLSGFSMDDVRVHYNSSKPATVQALAYTQGTDIHVAPGQEKHLPHEAWHVAQQMAGRVSPTTNINGMPVNDNAGLEHEADVMGEKAIQCKYEKGNIHYGQTTFNNTVKQFRRLIKINSMVHQILTDPDTQAGPVPADDTSGRTNVDTHFSWHVKFDISLPDEHEIRDAEKYIKIIVNIFAPNQEKDLFETYWKHPIEQKFNNKFTVVGTPKIQSFRSTDFRYPLIFEVNKVGESGVFRAHQTVRANTDPARGLAGTENMSTWGKYDTIDITHEFAHMLGAKDEYCTVDGRYYGKFRTMNTNIMHNPALDVTERNLIFVRDKLRELYPTYDISITRVL